MKKIFSCVFVLVLLLFILSACVNVPDSYTVPGYGQDIIIDTENSTITCGIDTYTYELSKYGIPYKLNIHYPDGSSYWWQQDKNSGFGGWSNNYNTGGYLSGEVLRDALEYGFPEDRSDRIIPCFLLLLLACVHILAPIGMWACYFGMYREGEPPDTELWGIRLLGVLIIMGTAAWFWDCF